MKILFECRKTDNANENGLVNLDIYQRKISSF